MSLPLPVGSGREERRRRIDEIRRAVRAGTYRIEADRVADAVLAVLRERRER